MRTIFYYPIRLSVLLFTLAAANTSYAQDTNTDNHTITITIPNVAILDLEPAASKNITAVFTAPAEAGDPIAAPADNTALWLNYSSILTTGVVSRKVEVSITNGILDYPGLIVKVLAGAASTGAGTRGTPGAEVTLAGTSADLITGIGSAYTVTGENSGHLLTYSFETDASAYGSLSAGDKVLTVTYTLTDVN